MSVLIRPALSVAALLAMSVPALADVTIDVAPAARTDRPVSVSVRFTGDGGFDLGGIAPRAWLVADPRGDCAIPATGSDAREIDGRLLVTLNADRTISAVDPARSIASGNIAWIAQLPEQASAWFIDPVLGEAMVALAQTGEIQRIDLADGRMRQIVGDIANPEKLLATPEIGGFWSLDADRRRLLHLDGDVLRAAVPLAERADAIVWIGHRRLLAVAAGRRLHLAEAGGAWRSAIMLDRSARALVASPLADALYVLAADGRSIASVGLDGSGVRDSISIAGDANKLLVSPDGRWLFAIDGEAGLLSVIDAADGRLTRAFQIHAGIAAAAFSDGYLYLRERERAFVSMLRLASLAEVKEHLVAIPAGLTGVGTLAPLGGDGMAMLNPDERTAYLYMESGMADGHGTMRSPTEMQAPYATVQFRGGTPLELAVVERGLRQSRPGHFTASLRPRASGQWRIVVRDARSGEMGCRDFDVTGPETAIARAVRPALHSENSGKGGAQSPVLLSLVDPATGARREGPRRLELLAFVPGGNWQAEASAQRQADGLYRLDGQLPRGARVGLVPLDPTLDQSRPLILDVVR